MTIGRPVSGRHAARLARVAEKTARGALEDLVNMGILMRREATGQYLFSANRDHVLWEPLRHLFDSERARASSLRAVLKEAAIADGVSVASLAIFGSAARGRDAPGSDLDLLALVDSQHAVELLRERLAALIPHLSGQFGILLSPIVMTAEHFRERYVEGDAFTAAAIRDAEVLFGRHPEAVAHG